MHNKEVHSNLYRNKNGIHLNSTENLPTDYKRPPGFSLVPTLLNASMQNKCIDGRQQLTHQKPPQHSNASKSTTTASNASAKSTSQITYNNHTSKNEMSRLVFIIVYLRFNHVHHKNVMT